MANAISAWLKDLSWSKIMAEVTVNQIIGQVMTVIGSAFVAWWAAPSEYTRLGVVLIFIALVLSISVSAIAWRRFFPIQVKEYLPASTSEVDLPASVPRSLAEARPPVEFVLPGNGSARRFRASRSDTTMGTSAIRKTYAFQ